MKYIQKTFMNLNETDKIDELSAWYVKHKIRRFLSSRTKVPLWVYRKINFISSMQDFYHLNDHKNDYNAILEWNYLDRYIYIKFPSLSEELIYLDGSLEHYKSGRLLNSYDIKKPCFNKTSLKAKFKFPNMPEKRLEKFYDMVKKSILRQSMNNGEIIKPLNSMKNYELYQYYKNLDKNSCNLQHLAYLENLMLDRNLENFTHKYEKHDLNNPLIEDFIIRGLREYQF